MLIETDPFQSIVHDDAQWRPFTGAARPPWIAGRVRALREAEDDAQTVLALVLTGLATHAINPAEVVWVVDLAPGEGERAWRVLRSLSGRAPRGPPIRYLARCGDAGHHARLSAHPMLKPLISNGDLYLDRMGQGVPPHPVRNPIVVLAHEGLSSQAQGLYAAHAGELLEAWVDGDDGMDWRATTQRDGVMRLLSAYRQSLDGVAFTLPRGSMETLAALLRVSGGRLLLRASDRGAREIAQIRLGALEYRGDDGSDRNRNQGLRVNFEALARWHLAQGASVQQTQRDDDGRVLHLAVHDTAGGRLQECLPEIIGLPHPDDHVQLLLAMESLSAVSPAQCLSLLHAQAGDPRAFLALSRHLGQVASSIEGTAVNQWRDVLAYCLAQHYPLSVGEALGNEVTGQITGILLKMQAHSGERAAIAMPPLNPEGAIFP